MSIVMHKRSDIQHCLDCSDAHSLRHLAAIIPSQLNNYSLSSFLPSFETWSIIVPFILAVIYRTLHSYNLIWAVCHLFPQQRWRTHTNNQSRETIGLENDVACVKLRPRKFRPAFFGADSKTRIFYKYVVFKHSFSFTQFPLQRQHTPSSVTLFHQQTSKSNNMDGPRKHSFLQNTLINSASETPTVLNHRKKRTS